MSLATDGRFKKARERLLKAGYDAAKCELQEGT